MPQKYPLLLSRNTLQCPEQGKLENKQNYELLHIGVHYKQPKSLEKKKMAAGNKLCLQLR
jgi:hypothetical protein